MGRRQMERQIERWNGSATLRAMLAGHGVSFVTVQPAPTQSPSATGAVQHSAAVPTVSAVTVAAGLAFLFVALAVHTKSAPQVPGVGAVQHSVAVPTVSAVTVAAGLAFVGWCGRARAATR